jgi:hypothetical protein
LYIILVAVPSFGFLADDNGRERFGSANGPQIVLEALTKDDVKTL